jgi:hypothetical protein
MSTILEIPLRDATPAKIQALQAKYPEAILRIEADNSLHSGTMDEDQFWVIIDLFDWRTRDSDAILAPAVEALSHFSTDDIHTFHNILNEKLYALDGQRFAEQLGSNRYSSESDKHFSVDSFLYARCCVVANGKKFFDKVSNDPTKMPKEFTFESLLYLPALAWKTKTGRDDYDYYPEVWSETFSNPEGWPGIVTIKDRVLNLK